MDIRRKLTVLLMDGQGRRQGVVGNYISCTVTERHLGQSTGEITVSASDPVLEKMLAKGAQVQVTMDRRYDESTPGLYDTGHRTIAGPLRDPRGSLLEKGTVTFQIEGWWRLLRNFPVWVNPDEALEASDLSDRAQSWNGDGGGIFPPPPVGEDSGRWGYLQLPYATMSASEASKQLIDWTVNARWQSRFGEPAVDASATLAGADVMALLPQMRFGTPESYIKPLLEYGNNGLRFVMDSTAGTDGRRRLRGLFYQPRTWAQVFTPESGVVIGGDWSITYPTATDAVLGGPGDLSARAFAGYSNAALSLAERDMIEVFRDATGAPVVWPDTLAEKYRIAKYFLLRPEIDANRKAAFTKFMADAGAAVLAEGATKSGVTVKIAESEGFRFTGQDGDGRLPEGFATGDVITVAPSQKTAFKNLRFTSRITETTLTQNRGEGLSITPQLGERKDDPDVQLALAIRDVAVANSRRSTTK